MSHTQYGHLILCKFNCYTLQVEFLKIISFNFIEKHTVIFQVYQPTFSFLIKQKVLFL